MIELPRLVRSLPSSKRLSRPSLAVASVLLLAAASARAQTPTCDALSEEGQRALAQKLIGSQYAYDCCDETLAACLKSKPVCLLVQRLADDICRRIGAGQDEQKIVRGLSRRARSMMPGGAGAKIDLSAVPQVGADDAPVQLVVYACARCPFCSKLVPALHRAVTTGALAGRVKMAVKVFPIRSHPYSKEAGLAFEAAARMHRFWDYALLAYGRMDDFCPKKQAGWAAELGLDEAAFEHMMADPETRRRLVESKKEGLRNRVEATPALFIDGRRYVGDLDMDELQDVLLEAFDRARGRRFAGDESPDGGRR